MAVRIYSGNPEDFLNRLIMDLRSDRIPTWTIDDEGDITISNAKWHQKAWFSIECPQGENMIVFGLIQSKYYRMTKELYGVYHGRLIATLLAYYDTLITEINVSAEIDADFDRIGL